MPESFAGITVPEGEPGALESGGARMEGLAGRLDGVHGGLNSLPGALAGWNGPASIAYEGGTLTNGAGIAAAIESLQALRAGEVAPDLTEQARRELAAARPAVDGAEHRTVNDRDMFDAFDEHLALAARIGQPLTVVDVPGY